MSASADGRTMIGLCFYMGIALNGNIFCISTGFLAVTAAAANARTIARTCCIHSGKALNGNVFGYCLIHISANAGTAIHGTACYFQAAGFIRVKILAGDLLALVIRCIGNGHGAIALFVQGSQSKYIGIIQYILAVQLNGGAAGAIHFHGRRTGIRISFHRPILILALTIRLDVHIAQADVQGLFHPVVDDADDVVGGVAFTALGGGLRLILVGGIALCGIVLGSGFRLLFYRSFLNFLLCGRGFVPGCFLRLFFLGFFLGFFFGSRCCFRFFGLFFRFPFGFSFRLLVGGLFLNLFRWLFFLRFLFHRGHFGFTNGGYGRGLGIRRLLYRLCHLRLLVLCAFIFLQGGIVLAGAVLQKISRLVS